MPSSRASLEPLGKDIRDGQARGSATLLPEHMQARSRGHATVAVGAIDRKRGLRGRRGIHHGQSQREGGGRHGAGGGEVLR